ncbi:BQ5605_C001g00940 [Microbotryum silenes-dioicae]|uniref:BQ5605_C001g00940 protein n=1 Tax=Microbotryum silenes-dioicae TaxID=796604 RepID=A0A2X0M4Q1_9BASI|nr:BQ5605_C001g00940 [Microbotryum silenes-dioicae]
MVRMTNMAADADGSRRHFSLPENTLRIRVRALVLGAKGDVVHHVRQVDDGGSMGSIVTASGHLGPRDGPQSEIGACAVHVFGRFGDRKRCRDMSSAVKDL